MLQGEESRQREAGSSFGGFVRVRPALWSADDVRDAIRKLWTAYKKHPKVLAVQGSARR